MTTQLIFLTPLAIFLLILHVACICVCMHVSMCTACHMSILLATKEVWVIIGWVNNERSMHRPTKIITSSCKTLIEVRITMHFMDPNQVATQLLCNSHAMPGHL